MKKLLIIALTTLLSFSAYSTVITLSADADLKASTLMAGSSALLIYGGTLGAGLVLTTFSAAALDGATAQKALIAQVKSDIQEYNLGGEISPLLASIINEAKEENSTLTIEDIVFNLENTL